MKMIYDVCEGNHRNNILSEKALRAVNNNYDKALCQEELNVKQLETQTETLRLMCRQLDALGSENQARHASTLAEVGKLKSNKSAIKELYLEHEEDLQRVFEEEAHTDLPTAPIQSDKRRRKTLHTRQSVGSQYFSFQRQTQGKKQIELQFVREEFSKLQAATGAGLSASGLKKREDLVQALRRVRDAKEQLMELKVARESLLQQRDLVSRKVRLFETEPDFDPAAATKLHARNKTTDEEGLREASKLAQARGTAR